MLSFDNFLGNTHIVASLKNSIINNRVSHAYILSGSRGMGKMLLAKTFAKAIECEQGAVDPCGYCRSCITFESGNHPDVFYVTPTKTKTLGVDDVREQVTARLETRPFSSPYKIFIIDNADAITVQSQNALLKSIEEPSGYGVFILLAQNSQAFLPTVLSRCICYKFRSVPEHVIKNYMIKKAEVSEKDAGLLSIYANGNIGRAIELNSDEEFIAMRDMMVAIVFEIKNCDLVQLFALYKKFEPYKERIQDALDILYMCYRDMLVVKSTGSCNFLIQEGLATELSAQAERYEQKELFVALEAIEDAKWQLKRYCNFQLTIEVMLMNLHGK